MARMSRKTVTIHINERALEILTEVAKAMGCESDPGMAVGPIAYLYKQHFIDHIPLPTPLVSAQREVVATDRLLEAVRLMCEVLLYRDFDAPSNSYNLGALREDPSVAAIFYPSTEADDE